MKKSEFRKAQDKLCKQLDVLQYDKYRLFWSHVMEVHGVDLYRTAFDRWTEADLQFAIDTLDKIKKGELT